MLRAASIPPPTPSARVVFGRALRVDRRPEGVASPVTTSLRSIAKRGRSLIAPH